MAQSGEIIIRIINESGGGESVTPDETETVTNEVAVGDKSTNNLATAAYVTMAQKAARDLKTVVVSNALKHQHWYYKMHDNYIANEQMEIATSIIGKTASAGATILSFATMGSAAGPIGAAVGAAVGTAIAAVNIGQDVAGNYIRERLKLTQMAEQLSYNRVRAGYSLSAGSVGENR